MNNESSGGEVLVWDRFIRFGHWTLALAFATAYLSAEELEDVHVAAGWWVLGWLVARTVWGFVGSTHARFADFVRGPSAVFGYLRGLLDRRAPAYLGHNPAGGAMVVALMLSLAGTVGSGLVLQGEHEHEGPFAGFFDAPAGGPAATAEPPARVAAATSPAADEDEREGHEDESIYGEIHELFANLSLTLVILHLLGVVASSLAHHENLPRAMITGRKRLR